MLDLHERLTAETVVTYFGIPVYTFWVCLGIIAGLVYYTHDVRKRGVQGEGAVIIVVSTLVCGAIGSKIPLLLYRRPLEEIILGKSIVGAILGGMLGTLLIKRYRGIKLKLGNIIAPCIALGMAIGRLGCFFGGCCYGIAATWGFDFGDGLLRLPTQLFESAFHLLMFAVLHHYKTRVIQGGLLLRLYFIAYFAFRFGTEFIRVNPALWGGMTAYQILCLLGILFATAQIAYGRRNREAN